MLYLYDCLGSGKQLYIKQNQPTLKTIVQALKVRTSCATCVVACRQGISTKAFSSIGKKVTKLHMTIAQYIWIRSDSLFVTINKLAVKANFIFQ